MHRFRHLFPYTKCNLIGMIHVEALPGTPKNTKSLSQIIDQAVHEASIYRKFSVSGLDSLMIENMHDIPYVKAERQGPEIVSGMTAVAREVRKLFDPSFPLGIQILAGGGKEALAVAQSSDFQFIRSEGFVFGHLGDEGWFEASAGDLLRYRKAIGAEDVCIFTDIKKKHSAHSVTQDVDIVETAKAAEFFLSDGLIVTGSSTGEEASAVEVDTVSKSVSIPVLVGSGVTPENIHKFCNADGLIVGSYFKMDGKWQNELDEQRIHNLCQAASKFKK